MKRLSTGVNVLLFFEAVVPVFGDKHQCHPIITGVTRNLFRAYANCSIQLFLVSCRVFIGQAALPAARDKDM